MQMFLFTQTTPYRDGDLDNQIIVHEYGHGVSNRLTGGPSNANALDAIQSGGMGEGWSDWWGLMFTQKSGDQKDAAYPMGTYVLGEAPNGAGIRQYPYSYNMKIDPHTLKDFNASAEVHDSGEIWASALWDMSWLLIEKYGFDPDIAGGYSAGAAGNKLARRRRPTLTWRVKHGSASTEVAPYGSTHSGCWRVANCRGALKRIVAQTR